MKPVALFEGRKEKFFGVGRKGRPTPPCTAGATTWLPPFAWGLCLMLLECPVTAGSGDLRLSTEAVAGPRGYWSWITHVLSPINDRWSVWAGYAALIEVSGAPNTPSLMFGGHYRDHALEASGGLALIFRQGPDAFSSTTLALDGGVPFHRLVPSVALDTWVEWQLAFTSSQSLTTSTTTTTNAAGRLRRFGTTNASSLFQTALGLDLHHPLSPSDTLHGFATGYFYNVPAGQLAQLPAVQLPDSGVAVPSLPASQLGLGTTHALFDRWEFSWEVTRTHDYYEPAPIDAYSLRAGWDVTMEMTARASWTRVTNGAGTGNYFGIGWVAAF